MMEHKKQDGEDLTLRNEGYARSTALMMTGKLLKMIEGPGFIIHGLVAGRSLAAGLFPGVPSCGPVSFSPHHLRWSMSSGER